MKRNIRPLLILVSFILMINLFSSCGGGDDLDPVKKPNATYAPINREENVGDYENKGIFLNIDVNTVTFPFLNKLLEKDKVTEEDLYSFVDQYVNTQITDVAFNINTQISFTRSDVLTDVVERYNTKEVNGKKVDFTQALGSMYGIYEIQNIDPYYVWISRTREQGLNAWISIRMNDCHDQDLDTSWLHGQIYYDALKNGWTVKGTGNFKNNLDYSASEVRQTMLDYIREQILRYDVDGLELDFSREIWCFNMEDGKDHLSIMNDFMRKVNAIVSEAETKWGHDIRINLRLMRDIEQTKAFGFDVDTMVNEKLLDAITVCPRWASNDSDMPVAQWKEKYPSVEIYAGLTDLTYNLGLHEQNMYAYAAEYLQQGADKTYLFNFFNNPLAPNPKYINFYNTCGSLATLSEKEQWYVVTYQDIVPPGYNAWDPLPARASGFDIGIKTGPVKTGTSVKIYASFDHEITADDMKMLVNGKEATFIGLEETNRYYNKDSANKYLYCFSIDAQACNNGGVQLIELVPASGQYKIYYLELTVTPAAQ